MALATVRGDKKRPKNRKNKINLVFDDVKRREFLSGFHKRKLQRKKEAKEKLEKDLKEERKRLKAAAKDSYKKLVVSHRDIPELQNYLSQEYEEDDVTVKVVELSTNEIAKQNNWIGANQPKYENDLENSEAESGAEEALEEKEEVPGMELKAKPVEIKKKESKVVKTFKSAKELKKELKKQATKKMQKSKVFQKKNKIEQRKQKKQSMKTKMKNAASSNNNRKFGSKKFNKSHKRKE